MTTHLRNVFRLATGWPVAQVAAPIEVTEGFFELFGLPPLMGGRWGRVTFQGARRSAVLSFELWTSMVGGDPAVVGRFVNLGHARWTIVDAASLSRARC